MPANPKLPSRSVLCSSLFSIGSAIAVGLAALFSFRVRRVNRLSGGAASADATADQEG